MGTVFRIPIDPVLGHLPMGQVRPSHLWAWVKNRSAVLAPCTLAVACSYFTALFTRPDPPRRPGLHLGTGPPYGRHPESTGPRCFRHYFATALIHNRASVKTIQMMLGQATPTITLKTCVGEWPEPHEKTRSTVDGALGRVPQMCPDGITPR